MDVATFRGRFPDLSKAAKLKDLMFLSRACNIHWIVAALKNVEYKNLRQLTIRLETADEPEETDDEDWQDLDRLLVQFWTSYSIRPQLGYAPDSKGRERVRLPDLLPELTKRELVDLVEYSHPA